MSSEHFQIAGLKEFRALLTKVGDGKDITRIGGNALRRGARRIASATIKEQKQRGVLKSVFGKDSAGLRKRIHPSRLRSAGGVIEVPITVKGLAAIQETGGRMGPHVIEPSARKLVFVTHGKFVVTGKRVNHPGATHPKMSTFVEEFERGQRATIEDVQKSIGDYLAQEWASG